MAWSGEMRRWFTLLLQAPLLLLVAIVCGTAASAASAASPAQAQPGATAAPASATDMLQAPESQPKYGGVLRWAGLAAAPFFDLHQCDTAACATPMEPMYNTLLRYSPLDGGKTVIPDLAYKWEVSSDGLTYTFHLREGVKFHDGALLTADDVKASFDHIISPPPGILSPRKGVFDTVKEVKVVDPLTVQFVLSAPRSYFLAAVASGWNVIYRKKTLEDNNFDLKKLKLAPGTGPFIFDSYQPGQVWKMHKNPHYWNPKLPYLDGLEMHALPYGPATAAALLSGKVDYAYGLGADTRDDVKKQPDKFTTATYGIPSSLGGYLNFTHKPLEDVRVRQAMNLVLDRCVIKKSTAAIREINHGMWMPSSDVTHATAYREATLNHTPGYYCPTRKEDIAQARDLLAKAGYPDGKGFPKLDIMVRNLNFLVAWGPLLQAFLKQHLNIESTVRTVETAIWVDDWTKGNYDIGINGNPATLNTPAEYWQKWYGTGSTGNWNKGASNPELDVLVGKLATETDPQKLNALIQQGTKILNDWVPSLVFGEAVIIDGFSNQLKGCNRKDRVTLFDDNRFDTCWLDK
jgi:peptide/nickel transport system substrate-binding protein